MDIRLKGKRAVITGGAAGVGEAIAKEFAAAGAAVAIADIDEAGAHRVAEELRAQGAQALAVKTDVRRSDQVENLIHATVKTLGGLDIMVANAGIVGPQGPWHELPEEGFDRVVAVNFRGQYLCCKYAARHMIGQRSGRIIITSSCAGKTGEPMNGVYSTTKAAGINMTQSLALELAPYNITVNAICPAAMDTELMEEVYRERAQHFGLDAEELRKKIKNGFPLPYDLGVNDVAYVAVFLASEQARNLTGQAINVTGGIEMH